MTDTVGLELSEALRRLEAEGIECVTVEVSSRKGVRGNEARVIRQRAIKSNETGSIVKAELCFSVFKTDVDYS